MAGVRPDKLAVVVERFYAAAARPELWQDVLADYAEAAGGMGSILISGPAAKIPPVASEGLAEAVTVGLQEGWYDRNPRVARGFAAMRGPFDVLTEERIFAYDEVGRDPFYDDFLYRVGGGWFAGMVLVDDGPATLMLSLERSRQQGMFEQRELADLKPFVRHLQQAGQLAARLAGSHQVGMLSGLEMLGCGGMVLDAFGAVVQLNRKAEVLIGDGLRLTLRRLAFVDTKANTALQRLVGALLQRSPVAETKVLDPVIVPRPGRRPLIVHGAPIVGDLAALFQQGRAILMIVDPEDHPDPAAPILRQAFGLTGAECRVATALARGRDAETIARSFGVREATVRTQIKTILAKTETRRQAELVSLLTRMTIRSIGD